MFFALSVTVKNETLQDSLAQYVKGELLDGDNAYFCEKCGEKVRLPLFHSSRQSHWKKNVACGANLRHTSIHREIINPFVFFHFSIDHLSVARWGSWKDLR